MNITICGGGNTGHVLAGFLGAQPNIQLNILTQHPSAWEKTIQIIDIHQKEINGQLHLITDQAQAVIPDSDMVILCLPGFALEETLRKIAPYLKPNAIVGSIIASTGFFFMVEKIFSHPLPHFSFQRVPFISRILTYGKKAALKGYKEELKISTVNMEQPEVFRDWLSQLLQTKVTLLDNIYEASLTNSNPLLHTSRLYTLFGDHSSKHVYAENPAFYSDWTNEASDLLIAMDEEFQHLLRKMNIKPDSIPPILSYYESTDAQSLTAKMRSISAFKGIYSPMIAVEGGWQVDYKSRYFTEDFNYSLQLIIQVAKAHQVETPLLEKIYNWGLAQMEEEAAANNSSKQICN